MEFLRKILPSQGLYVLASFKNGLKRAPVHTYHETVEALHAEAMKEDAAGINVFHANATFATRDGRTQDNAAFVRSLWLDVDVGKANDKNSYTTRAEAMAAIGKMLKDLTLPMPTIVQSGAGYHLYWVLNRDMEPTEWKELATSFSNALTEVGFKEDPSCTKDEARILRPVGSHWYKNEEAREIKLLRDSPVSDVATIEALLAPYKVKTLPARRTGSGLFALSNDLGGGKEYAPSSAYQVIKFCPTLKEVAEKQGDVDEPLWRAMIGVVKACTEGDTLIHEWSKGYAGYNQGETQAKIDAYQKAPTKCETFSSLSSKCNGCKFNGKITSPIQLGIVEEEQQTIEIEAAIPHGETVAKVDQFTLPTGYSWNGTFLTYSFTDGDGVVHAPIPFARQLFTITTRIRTVDGVARAECSRMVYPGVWRKFEIETSLIPQKLALAAALAAHEIYTIGKKGTDMLAEYIVAHLEALRTSGVEAEVYDSFGWHNDMQQFVIGNVALEDGNEREIRMNTDSKNGGKNKVNAKAASSRAGTAQQWTKNVNQLYGMEGAEAAQFIIAASFASSLIEVAGLDGFHGIPISISGLTGSGKTKVCNIANSVWGPASAFQFQAATGMTANSRIALLAQFKNVPVLYDEITGVPFKELAALYYDMSQGSSKQRLKQDGTFAETSHLKWNMIPFITCQNPIESVLAGNPREVLEATALRSFTIDANVDAGWGFPKNLELVEENLNTQYGEVGRVWTAYIIPRREEIKAKLVKFVSKYVPDNLDPSERYYRQLVAFVIFACKLATGLGLIKFDAAVIQAWAENHVDVLRGRRISATYSPEDYLSGFLGSLIGSTIVTDHFGTSDRRLEHTQETIRFAPVARRILKDKPRLIVSRKAFIDHCVVQKIESAWLLRTLKEAGYILENPKVGAPICVTGKMTRLATGTSVQMAPVYALEFNVNKITDSGTLREHLAEVVPIASQE